MNAKADVGRIRPELTADFDLDIPLPEMTQAARLAKYRKKRQG